VPETIGLKREISQSHSLRSLKKGIWLYLILLLFEGALRKWFLPALSSPLLLIRDPIAIWLILSAFRKGLFTFNIYLSGIVLISIISFFTAIFLGHQNVQIAIYGTRIFLFHFPLIFVIGKVLDREDVIDIGKFFLWVTIPMTILVAMQFYSPQSALVNRGIGGDIAGGGFSGSNGYFRPPATFSFITGTVQFYGLVACFVLYFLINSKGVNKVALFGALTGLLASVPLSISRTMLFQVVIAMLFLFFVTFRNPKYLGKLMLASIALVIVLAGLSQASFFQTATATFTERFEVANESEGGMKSIFLDRFLGGMVGALTKTEELPFFGHGIGMGTNVASQLLSKGQTFLISEEEWGRLIGELGPLLGLMAVILRCGLCFKIAKACYLKLGVNDSLPWMLLSFGFLSLLQGQWAQPTSLGFSIVIGGLMLAALRDNKKDSTIYYTNNTKNAIVAR
jgi:hypothetical protein